MPWDGSQNYYYPPGTPGIPDQTIESESYNTFLDDLVANDLNTPRPIHRGGTGAATASQALINLKGEISAQHVDNFLSHVWQFGSFYSPIGAIDAPNATHGFSGICYGSDGNNFTVEARNETTGEQYIRMKIDGDWQSAWTNLGVSFDERYVNVTGDTMTGRLTINGGGLLVDTAALPGAMYNNTISTPFFGLKNHLGLNAYVGSDGAWKAWTTGYVGAIAYTPANGTFSFQATTASVTAGNSAPFSEVAKIDRVGGIGCTSIVCSGSASFVGTTTVTGPSTSAFFVKAASGGVSDILAYTGTTGVADLRWRIRISDDIAESSTATGSNFKIFRYNNSGVSLGVPFEIDRALGVTKLSSLEVNGNVVVDGTTIAEGTLTAENGLIINKPSSHTGGITIYGTGSNSHSISSPTLGLGIHNVLPSTLRHELAFAGTSRFIFENAYFYPATAVTLGTGTYKWGQIYSTSGTINTSDENLKQDIRPLTPNELNAARAMKGMVRAYRLKSEVADNPNAKTRIGVIAQQIIEVMTANGMDWRDYAFISADEQYTETLNKETQSYDRTYTGEIVYSVIYDELQCWILAAMLEELALLRAG